MRVSNTWQYKELVKHLQAIEADPVAALKSVRLVNMKQAHNVERIILEDLWPGVQDGMQQSRLIASIHNFPESAKTEPSSDPDSGRKLVFLLDDPIRPRGGDMPPWFFRGTISASTSSYNAFYELHLYFPVEVGLEELSPILQHPNFVGIPPVINYDKGWTVVFNKGFGASWGLKDPGECKHDIADQIRGTLDIIKKMMIFEAGNFQDSKSFVDLQSLLVYEYGTQ